MDDKNNVMPTTVGGLIELLKSVPKDFALDLYYQELCCDGETRARYMEVDRLNAVKTFAITIH